MPNRKIKQGTIVGVFETKARAEQAITELKKDGFDDTQIGMIYRDADGETVKTGAADETYAEEGAVTGAAVGAAGGALVGAGILAGVIPVIGPVLAVGALGTVLLNAAGGAVIAGLTGALIGWGISEEDAKFYEDEVAAGRYLVTLTNPGDRAAHARAILHRHSGFDRTTWDAVRADRANMLADREFRTPDGRVIQLHEEQLNVHKENVQHGDVKVRKEVKTEHQTVTVPVEREEVVIERRPASGRATGRDIKAEEIRIPVREEKARVTKETVVKEEVRVGKRKVRENETVSGDVRKEELVVESDGKAKVRTNSKSGKK